MMGWESQRPVHEGAGEGWRGRVILGFVVLVVGWFFGMTGRADDAHPFRIGLSRRASGDVKHNDAKAAFRAWARTILAERSMVQDADAVILETAGEIREAARSPEFDGIATSTTEFLELGVEPESLFLTVRGGKIAQSYVVVVPQESPIAGLADLLGKKVLVPSSPRMELAMSWLTVAMDGAIDKSTPGNLTLDPIPTATKAVLRVFFRQAAASLVTAPALAMAAELNPQVASQVRVIATSPEVVTGVFFLNPRLAPDLRISVERTITTLHESPVGRQVLTVFQADRMERRSLADLAATRALLQEAQALTSRVQETSKGGEKP